jgi:hypothetical protein
MSGDNFVNHSFKIGYMILIFCILFSSAIAVSPTGLSIVCCLIFSLLLRSWIIFSLPTSWGFAQYETRSGINSEYRTDYRTKCYNEYFFFPSVYASSQSIFATAFCLYFYLIAMSNNFINFNIIVVISIAILLAFDIVKKYYESCASFTLILTDLIISLLFAAPMVFIVGSAGGYPSIANSGVAHYSKSSNASMQAEESSNSNLKCKVFRNGNIVG